MVSPRPVPASPETTGFGRLALGLLLLAALCSSGSASSALLAVPRGGLDVGLDDPPAGAGALQRRQLDAQLPRHAARDRRGLDAAVALLGLRLRRSSVATGSGCLLALAASGSDVLRRGSSARASSRACACLLAAAFVAPWPRAPRAAPPRPPPPSPICAIVSPTGSVSPSWATIVSTPCLVGLVGHVGLVGLDLDELLAALDLVPVGLQPLEDRALLHRVGQAGHRDVGHAPQRIRRAVRVSAGAGAATSNQKRLIAWTSA